MRPNGSMALQVVVSDSQTRRVRAGWNFAPLNENAFAEEKICIYKLCIFCFNVFFFTRLLFLSQAARTFIVFLYFLLPTSFRLFILFGVCLFVFMPPYFGMAAKA